MGDLRGYYEVAYSPSNREFDGHFRKITLKVSRPGVAVQTRSGYFAMPPGEGTATFPYEVQLLKAMRSSEPPRDLPVREKLFRFGPEPGGQRFTLVLELPLQAVRFERDQDPAFERAHFSFMGVLRTSWGSVAQKFSQDAPLWLPRQRHDELKQGNAVFMRSFTLPEGRYRMETAAMDRQTGRTSVEQAAARGAPGRAALALSSLALVKRTEQVARGALASDDPFRAGEVRIVPWVTEAEIDPARELRIFFVAYVPGRRRGRRRWRSSSAATGGWSAAPSRRCPPPMRRAASRTSSAFRPAASSRASTRCAPSCAAACSGPGSAVPSGWSPRSGAPPAAPPPS